MKFLIWFGCIFETSIKVMVKTITRVDEHEIFAKFIGELDNSVLLDFVSYYRVRCKNCKQSTWVQMVAQDAIDEWNAGNIEYNLQDIMIE